MGTHSYLVSSPLSQQWKLELKFWVLDVSEFSKGTRFVHLRSLAVFLWVDCFFPTLVGSDHQAVIYLSTIVSFPPSRPIDQGWLLSGAPQADIPVHDPGAGRGTHINNLGMSLFGRWGPKLTMLLLWIGHRVKFSHNTYTSKRKTNKENAILSKHSICWVSIILFL